MVVAIVAGAGLLAAGLAFAASASRAHPAADPIDPTSEERALQRFIRRRPKLCRFVGERFDRRRAGGYILTVGFLVVFAVALGLGLLLALINHNDVLAHADAAVSRWGADHAGTGTVDVLRWTTDIGATPVVFTYLVALALIDFARRRNREVFAFVAAVGIGQNLLNNGIKLLVRRNRPAVLHLVTAHGFSFPSGHSCAAAAATSAVALILGRDRRREVRAGLAAVAALLTIAVAASRALLGVHWLSDVIAGVLLGWGWFMLVAVVFGGRRQRLGDPVASGDVTDPTLAASAMSTASTVPETIGLDGERAVTAIRDARVTLLLRDSFARLRWADGFSSARAMAFQVVMTLIPGAIVVVALAAELRWGTLSDAIGRLANSLAPGPTGKVFTDAFEQGSKAGSSVSGWLPLGLGAVAFLLGGTTGYGQIERSANRIYGVEADRPAVHKYGVAALLMVTSGVLAVAAIAILGLGQRWASNWPSGLDDAWEVGRWPVTVVLLTGAFALIFKISPRRRQPELSWLAVGGLIGVVGVIAVSLLLHLYLAISGNLGDTYGPLAGFVGVLLWAYLTSIVSLFGLAFAAQLEAFRAGRIEPRSTAKVHDSDPPSDPTDLGEHVDAIPAAVAVDAQGRVAAVSAPDDDHPERSPVETIAGARRPPPRA